MHVCSSTYTPEMGPCSTPPSLVSSPDPKYPEDARKANYGDAQVVLWLVITEEGKPSKIRVQKAAGHGFDEEAIAAVKQWTFSPAVYQGRPVPVMVNIEVNFKLYNRPKK